MIARMNSKSRSSRTALAALELVLMLPMLSFVSLISVDYSRIFYAWATLADCSRSGALWASNSNYATSTPYTTYQQAALAAAPNLSPAPTLSLTNGTDASGNAYVQVTASYQFKTFTNYPTLGSFAAIPNSVTLTRTIMMIVTP
jgi:Flp pilus assembly protein TadG